MRGFVMGAMRILGFAPKKMVRPYGYSGVLVEIVREESKAERSLRTEMEWVYGCSVMTFSNERGSFVLAERSGEVLFHSDVPFDMMDPDRITQYMKGGVVS